MHVGLGRPNAMTKAQMDFLIDAIKNGTAVVEIQREAAKYRRQVKTLKYKVAQLEMKLKRYEWGSKKRVWMRYQTLLRIV